MKIFKVYKWDCIIRWVLFGLVAFLSMLASDAFDLISYPIVLGGFTLLLYLAVFVHFILWLIALIFSIKNKKIPAIIFCIIAPIISISFLFFLIIIHVSMTGGV